MHILERFLIHFFAASSLVLAVWFALKWWTSKNTKVANWISPYSNHLLVTSALIVWALSTLREPFDLSTGQTLTKAVFDFSSWLLGCGVSVLGLYRFKVKQ